MFRTVSALAAIPIAIVGATTVTVLAQSGSCSAEHAKMGHCTMAQPKAGETKMDHSKMDHGSGPAAGSAADTASTKAYMAANDKMHAEMSIPFTGNADIDFVKGMIPHHKGAVDMAKIVLQYGKDAALKKLAQDIITAQDKEIEFMTAWLAKNAK
jgi:uncharacterized protein (DUF305 family)